MPEHANTDAEIAACYDVMAELRPHVEPREIRAADPLHAGKTDSGLPASAPRVAWSRSRVIASRPTCSWATIFTWTTLSRPRPSVRRATGANCSAWLRGIAVENGCKGFHLDSGVQRKRAHEFYLREGLELSSYHFSVRLNGR